MKILCVSDKVVEHLYSAGVAQRHKDIDLIIGCGDLPYYYLEFLVSMLNKPLFYVHGNHDVDKEYLADGSIITAPGGGTNLHRVSYQEGELLLAGLEGSIRYKE
ncbi:MAG: metallophosphoesterase, partial [Chloroflexota bacterium]